MNDAALCFEDIALKFGENEILRGVSLEVPEGAVVALAGRNGAGKSTLLNALQPGLQLKTAKISKYWHAGRHTTSFSKLHALDFGGWAVDTPGIRVFRLYDIGAAELRDLFPEFERFQKDCRFPNCSHDHEPECAVFDAVESHDLAASRYASYVELLDEVSKRSPDEDEEHAAPEP